MRSLLSLRHLPLFVLKYELRCDQPPEEALNSSAPPEIEFCPVRESDFPTLTAWLAEPHVRVQNDQCAGWDGRNNGVVAAFSVDTFNK